MNGLRYTLLSDGSSDRALLPLLTWLLQVNGVQRPIQPEWADLRRLPRPPQTLTARIRVALDLYPCDLLFIHRDAERQAPELRRGEIGRALQEMTNTGPSKPPVVCVIPIRMQEAWLLFDESAIRKAAANPNGRQPLTLPPVAEAEAIADPKALLHELIRSASGLHGYHLQKLIIRPARVTEFMEDFSPLRAVSAFQRLEADVSQMIQQYDW